MALVKFGGGVVSLAGKIAGNVFAKNRYGSIVRSWKKPINANSPLQGEIRSTAGQCQYLWNQILTAAERASWDEYARNVPVQNRMGETIALSGYNMFCRTNAVLLYNNKPYVKPAPEIFSLAETDSSLTCSGDESTQKISVEFDNQLEWAGENKGHMLLYAGQPQNPGVKFFNGPWKRLGVIDGNPTTRPTSPKEFSSPWVLGTGQKIFVRARIVRADGRLSGFFRCTGTVVD